MASRLIVDDARGSPPRRSGPDSRRAWGLVALLGLLMAVVGLTDVVLLWVPTHLGSAEWEFGTASAMFDALPVATFGIGLVLAGAIARGWRGVILLVLAVAWLMALLLAGSSVLYVLDLPLAWRGVTQEMRPVLTRAIVKTSILAVLYVGFYVILGVVALRCLRTAARAAEGEAK